MFDGGKHCASAPAISRPALLKLGASRWLRTALFSALLLLLLSSKAQTLGPISREVSVFNFGLPSANIETVSRELSLFNFGSTTMTNEAISRELSVFNFGLPPANVETISREVSVFNFGRPVVPVEALSREVSVFNPGQPSARLEAVSRELSVVNLGGTTGREAISREVSIFNQGKPTAPREAISRELSVFMVTNPLPDLSVTILSAPATATGGQSVPLTFIITNSGIATAIGPWTNSFLLASSTNFVFAKPIGSVAFTNSIAAGAAVTVTQLVTLPITAYGTNYLGVEVDSAGNVLESLEQNNTAFTNILINYPSLPDLAATAISSTNVAQAGQLYAIAWTVTNAGVATAASPWHETLLLADNSAGINPLVLYVATVSNSLASGVSVTRTQLLILPPGLSGNFWLAVNVDSADEVFEGFGETNNFFISAEPLLIESPDLQASFIASPMTEAFGQPFDVTWAVTNAGNGPALASWTDRIWLSRASNSIAGASLLASAPAATSPLPPAGVYTNSVSVTVPLNAQSEAGTYWVILQVDALNAVPETTETNNLLAASLALAVPQLPDLTLGQVLTPTQAIAGAVISASWLVTNIGAVTLMNSWRESVYLIPATLTLGQFATNLAPYPLVGAFTFTNNLIPGASIARTQQVTVPLNGPAGDLRLAVFADSDNSVIEQNETNNIGLALTSLHVPAVLSLTVPVTNVIENTSAPNLPCLVARNGDLSSPLIVSFATSATNHLRVPATVTIAAGTASAAFMTTVLDDGIVDADVWVIISAQAVGYAGATSQVFVANSDLPRLTLSLAGSQILEGQTVAANVYNDTPMNQPVAVTIISSNPGRLNTPSSVTIPANSNSVSFTMLAPDNTSIDPAQVCSVVASAPGFISASTNLTVLDNDAPALTLSLDRTNMSEGDGPFAVAATVTRAPVTDQAVTLALSSSNTAAALVPPKITIPALQGQASFYVAAIADNLLTGPKLTLLSAQSLDTAGHPAGNAATELLVVQDTNGPALILSIANKIVPKGVVHATTATVSRNTPATNDLVVTFTSSATSEVGLPVSLTISNGQTTATFAIDSLNDAATNTSRAVTITASATNFASGSDVITVTDLGLPDLVISSITAPASAFTGEPFTLSFRLLNQGLGPLTNLVTQNVYLTSNPGWGTNLLVGTASFSAGLAAGQFADQLLSIPALAVPPPGTYWVVVAADAGSAATELNEFNNLAVSHSPLVISIEYTATVKAGVTNAVAGTPISLSGAATLVAGGPAANKSVNILLTVRGLQRVISVTTDANGNFSTVFTPLPTEAGLYTVAAVAPGIASAPPQDYFTILGATLRPESLTETVNEGGSQSSAVTIEDLGEVPLTGLTASIVGLAANLSATANLSTNYLAGQGVVTLAVLVSASDASIRQSAFTVHFTTAEGVALDLPVNVAVTPLVAQISTAPAQLSAAMLRGAQTIVQFEVVNLGAAPSGPLTVSVPSVPWLSVASTNPLPSLAPSASNLVTLVLTPAADLPLGPYTGALTISGSGLGLTVPFAFNCVSDAHGALLVHSVDEFTFFATGSPPLTNANITLIEPFSRAIVATGITDTAGQLMLPNLMEGIYELDVTATQHAAFKGSATVTAGITNVVETFLSRQTVTYTWTVVPTQVQDVTHITVQAEFEANVPAPVVVPSPASLDLAALQQSGQFMDVPITLANYGLIAVHGVTISISENPLYQFDLLTKNIGDLPAHGSVTVPMRITRLASQGLRKSAGEPCTISMSIGYLFLCGKYDVSTGIPIPVFNVSGDCGTTSGGGGVIVGVGCPDCTGGPVIIPPGQSGPSTCDQCMAKAILECAIGYTPAGCPYGVWSCLAGLSGGVNESSVENCVVQGVGCLGPWGNTAACLWSFLRCKCNGPLSSVPSCVAQAIGGGPQPMDASIGLGLSPLDPRDVYVARSYSGLRMIQMIIGDVDGRWFSSGSGGAFDAWFTGFEAAIQSGSTSGLLIASGERASLLNLPRPNTVTDADVQSALDRWNLTINNWRAGIYSPTNVPSGGNTNFIDLYALSALATTIAQQYQAAQTAGYADPVAGFFAAIQDAESKLGGGGTCARVVLRLDQNAVLTRDAFNATFQLDNNGVDPLGNISVNLVVKNAAGEDVTSLFGLERPTLTGALNAVDGTGALQPNSAGSAQWLLIPTLDAAPQAPTNYSVGGTFSYTINGVAIGIPLSPAPITVQPNPQLYVNYFHQRDVFADDPYTPQIEPSIPYSLAVMVQNRGYGIAHDFRITSAQPTIVDNQKGLLVDFKIIGEQVGNQPVSPSLTVDFGDLAPGTIGIGRWLLTSTLQGLFVNYSATFEHVDPLGNPRLSLIDGVEIHEMTHLVHADGAWEDGLPDFLVNDVPDFNNLPDTLYLSDGHIEPVSVVQSAMPDAPASNGHLQVQLTATFPSGFAYVRVPDPGNGSFQLVGVTRAGGSNFLAENFWSTDRTFIGLGQPPVHENILHLLDYHTNAGPDTYTLVYSAPSSVPQTNPPVSAVFALPAFSPVTFGVVWSGANSVGQATIAYFDIFVSDNNSPFTVWQSHTTATGALYSGQPGHTYAFYSIATDTAGNVEAPPIAPDAVTTVALSNTPPTISFASPMVIINEGDTLSIAPTVSDPDLPPETFTFKLGPGAPAGLTINPSSGLITWPTTELDGPSTNTILVIVTDNGFPPLSATSIVTVVVNEVNTAPILAPVPNYTIAEGFLLKITNIVVDYDIPKNVLVFSLGSPTPRGATINPTNGVFSWQPDNTQGPSTNPIAMIVTDNGIPPLSATQQFSVTVLDTLSDLTLSLGSTNVLDGESNTVPLVLAASLQLTNINLQLTAPGVWLTNLGLRLLSAEVSDLSFSSVGTDTYAVNFNLNPALQSAVVRSVAALDFLTKSNYHSAIVPLGVDQILAQQATGRLITNGTGLAGRIVIVGREPVLGINGGTTPDVIVYGRPGATYSLLANTNLLLNDWAGVAEFVQTNRVLILGPASGGAPATFYRALEFKPEPPIQSPQSTGGSLLNLKLSGWPGVYFSLETAPESGIGTAWTASTQFILTNSSQTILWTNIGGPAKFFRGKVP
jgi:subtilase family serine protease